MHPEEEAAMNDLRELTAKHREDQAAYRRYCEEHPTSDPLDPYLDHPYCKRAWEKQA